MSVVIFGTGKAAEMAFKYMERDGIKIASFTADKEFIKDSELFGRSLIPFESVEKTFPPSEFQMLVAIGHTRLNALRKEKFNAAKAKGYQLASYISPDNHVWENAKFGDNCLVLENQVIQPNVNVGDDTVIWSGNHFGHDVKIGNHVFIASHAVIGGGASIGDNCFIGMNATIRNHVNIAPNCLIGAGALILKDTKEGDVFVAEQTKRYPLNSNKFEELFG